MSARIERVGLTIVVLMLAIALSSPLWATKAMALLVA